jgi:NAD(P)-dependent dehydrogenase (short-subunit alcohol dehydrogenase family)
MSSKIVLVTGATEGIGKATALQLADKGYRVVIHGRNAAKAQAVVDEIKQVTGNADIDYLLADLSSLARVKEFTQAFQEKYDRLDILINNAAAMFTKRQSSQDGHEMMLAVNYLALVMLTENLLGLIKKTPGARIVNLSSTSYKVAKFDIQDIECRQHYNMMTDYGNSKLYVLYYSLDLAERLKPFNVPVNAVHPGGVRTQLARDFQGPLKYLFALMMPLFFISPAKGAKTSVFVATDETIANITGKYFVNMKKEKLQAIGYDLNNRQALQEFTMKALEITLEM